MFSLVGVGAAIFAFYFRLFVCFSASVVCIFSDEDRGGEGRLGGGSFCFQEEKSICLHAMNAKQKNKQQKNKYGMVFSHHILKTWHQKEASASTWFTWWFQMPKKYECQILVPVDMNIVLI